MGKPTYTERDRSNRAAIRQATKNQRDSEAAVRDKPEPVDATFWSRPETWVY